MFSAVLLVKKILSSKFTWYKHDLSKIEIYVLVYSPTGNGLWKYLTIYFWDFQKIVNKVSNSLAPIPGKYGKLTSTQNTVYCFSKFS